MFFQDEKPRQSSFVHLCGWWRLAVRRRQSQTVEWWLPPSGPCQQILSGSATTCLELVCAADWQTAPWLTARRSGLQLDHGRGISLPGFSPLNLSLPSRPTFSSFSTYQWDVSGCGVATVTPRSRGVWQTCFCISSANLQSVPAPSPLTLGEITPLGSTPVGWDGRVLLTHAAGRLMRGCTADTQRCSTSWASCCSHRGPRFPPSYTRSENRVHSSSPQQPPANMFRHTAQVDLSRRRVSASVTLSHLLCLFKVWQKTKIQLHPHSSQDSQ